MSHSVRFLAMAVVAWAGMRAFTIGISTHGDALAATLRSPTPVPGVTGDTGATIASPELVALPPGGRVSMAGAYPAYGWPGQAPPGAASDGQYGPYGPYPYPYPPPPPYAYAYARPSTKAPRPQTLYIAAAAPSYFPSGNDWLRAAHLPDARADQASYVFGAMGSPAEPASLLTTLPQSTPAIAARQKGLDRLRLSAWSFYRQEQPGLAAPPGLAPAGMLGGSQAGARLSYFLTPRLAASARYYAAIGNVRGSEAALGVRVQPLRRWPLAITAERRQRIDGSGRSAFAMFAETGAYGVPLPAGFSADGYAQAGVVGLSSRDWFVDAQLAATRPLWKNISGGGGVWTSAQPGLSRVDIGPRLSMPVAGGFRLHADYRLKVAGSAAPESGAAVTLAGDF